MSSTVMMERSSMSMPSLGVSGSPGLGTGPVSPVSPGYVMVPRCTLKLEKCSGGMKIWCSCDDKMACSMVQNLCTMLAGGMCSCCVTYNGLTVTTCCLTMGHCKCEMTDSGVCITCTSGDSKCCDMIQGCCECLSCMLAAGCTCCVMLNNTPVCCGCCETTTSSKASSKK